MAAASKIDPSPMRGRILRQARLHFFAHGYSRFLMDELARELGMSKKTLYLHFAGKDEIVRAVIQDLAGEIRAAGERLAEDPELSFAEKMRGFVEALLERLAAVTPQIVRDLQRYAPPLYAHLEEMRRKNIPIIFGRLLAEGQTEGFVRADVPPEFALEFF